MRTKVETERERFREAQRRKRVFASAVLDTVRVKVADDPSTNQFSYPIDENGQLGRLERFVLIHHPEDIAARVGFERPVSLTFDPDTEPPTLTVTLGPEAEGRQE